MKKVFPASIHLALTFVWLVVSLYLIFLYAPQEETMGEAQRIFYIHFSVACTSLLAFFFVFLGSMGYLLKRSRPADDFAYASAEVGFLYCCAVLITGPLWAKPAWGIWWTWDPRLTSTFILWLLYIAYLMLRSYVTNPGRVEVLSAVFGILGSVDAVIDYMAIRWWRTQHPQPVIGGGPASGLDPRMWTTVFVTWGAFLCLFFYLLRLRMTMAENQRELVQLRRELAS
ncbi:MAG TPA: cytochrome c biogenesis protein CcsA [Terriglobia bacterium]|nr:cytochrome c biogenesis protein CcsA [Terriglobia bacterium]